MKCKIPEKLFKATGGAKTWQHYGVDENSHRSLDWKKYVELDLEQITVPRLKRLVEMLSPHSQIRGAAMMIRDIKTWMRVATEGDQSVKARTIEQFCSLAKIFLTPHPRHHVYERDEVSGVWLPYYVSDIEFHPQYSSGQGRTTPAHVTMSLFWMEFGTRKDSQRLWWGEDCLRMSVTEALAKKGLYVENEEMRAEYLADVKKWEGLYTKIGLQLRGHGRATDDLDGNDDEKGWSRYNRNKIIIDHNGNPAKLLVDVFQETDKEDRDRGFSLDEYFWPRRAMKLSTSNEEGEDGSYEDLNEEADDEDIRKLDEDTFERPVIEIPIHTKLAVFDMTRHLRLRVHVGQVEVYEYDRGLAKKLVLPKDSITLIEMLISSKGVFKDIVAGKSGGSIVLCCGKPGVGKTLTAEVYSESMERPLYSVQCSQLGTSPEDLEGHLMKVFARAQRWNAILLLDEADVYVMERGSDLQQNAIVGVFLRILEYYSGTLFLTTNRADRVDDAIASRCVARIDYELPPTEDQRKLWRILSETAGVAIPKEVIEAAIRKHNNLSGRDIKNVIKLASLMSASTGQPITNETIDFVKRFKPTLEVKP